MRFANLFGVSLLALALPASASAQYQQRGGITFFSSPNFSGARFTVTGPRQSVRVPFTVRSVILREGDRWQVCSRTDYRSCTQLTRSDRSVGLAVRSVRPLGYGPPVMPSPWREIARLPVRQGVLWDRAQVSNNQRYRQLIICAERNVVRLARFDAFFNNGQRQAFHAQLVLRPGQCSRPYDLQGRNRRLRSLTFTYMGWNPAYRGAVVVVRGLQR